MELDYDFVRELMIECADSSSLYGPSDKELMNFANARHASRAKLAFTVDRLFEAGYIQKASRYASDGPAIIMPGNLTWSGNEYLNNIRSNSVWEETKNKIKNAGISTSLTILGSVASSVIKAKLNLN